MLIKFVCFILEHSVRKTPVLLKVSLFIKRKIGSDSVKFCLINYRLRYSFRVVTFQ